MLSPMIFRSWSLLAVLCAAGARLAAQEVDVTSVKFANLRAPNGAVGNWFEAEIAVNVRPAPASPGQMVSRVRVTLTLGMESPGSAGGERRTEYYRAEAECVALEAGRSSVRFYLPPEIVKRDQLHGDPKFWTVAIASGGRAQVLSRSAAANALAAPESRKGFDSRAAAGAPANDGLLQPQFLTPFAAEYPRATPSFVRHDGR